MNDKDRERIKQAKGRTNAEGKAGRSQQNAEASASNVHRQLYDARQKVRQGAKAYIASGIADALSDIANGDFGDVGNEILASLSNFADEIDGQRLTLEAAELDPKYLLPSSSFSEAEGAIAS